MIALTLHEDDDVDIEEYLGGLVAELFRKLKHSEWPDKVAVQNDLSGSWFDARTGARLRIRSSEEDIRSTLAGAGWAALDEIDEYGWSGARALAVAWEAIYHLVPADKIWQKTPQDLVCIFLQLGLSLGHYYGVDCDPIFFEASFPGAPNPTRSPHFVSIGQWPPAPSRKEQLTKTANFHREELRQVEEALAAADEAEPTP